MGNVRMRAEQINYGATNVKVALDDLDPAALIALNNRMDKIDAWKATVKTEEKTGAEVTFTNALALAAVSLSAEIEAIQDLHGQDAPYVGGAGKNKLPMTVSAIKAANTDGTWSGNVYTVSNATITLLVDNDDNVYGFRVNGTTDAYITFILCSSFDLAAGTYIYNTPNLASGVCYLSLESPQLAINLSSSTSATLTHEGGTIRGAYFYSGAGKTFNNYEVKPMISTEGGAFAPYSNICPISGHSSVTITRTDAESQTADFTIQLGQTVYGGTLNLTTGAMTVTDKIIDLGSVNWSHNTPNRQFYCDVISDMKNTSNFFTDGIISSCYEIDVRTYADYNDAHCRGINGQRIYIVDTRTTDADTFKTLVTGQTVLYPLATPATIQLTPTMLEMLKGYNSLSSDGGGDITVEAYTGAAWGGDES